MSTKKCKDVSTNMCELFMDSNSNNIYINTYTYIYTHTEPSNSQRAYIDILNLTSSPRMDGWDKMINPERITAVKARNSPERKQLPSQECYTW